jgi:two-component system chemotaxis response regulator CheY
MKCLVVDPSATLRRALKNTLKTLGAIEVLEAADGEQALARAGEGVDVVVTEWNLPVVSGVDLVKRLRSDPATASLRILMLTPRNGKNDVLTALDAGVNAYLLKPFTPESLRSSIELLLGSAEGGQAAA